MTSPSRLPPSRVAGFRAKLLLAMMLVISAIVALVLYLAGRNLTTNVEQALQREFQTEIAGLHNLQELRRVALVERSRSLVRRPRIHAALEDGAIDLLYPSAEDELRDVLHPRAEQPLGPVSPALRAQFYRFLDIQGAVIPPVNAQPVGRLVPAEEKQLSLPTVPDKEQVGYLRRAGADASEAISEIIAMPIISTATGEVIAALVLGFEPYEFGRHMASGIQSGIWLDGRLDLAAFPESSRIALSDEIARAFASTGDMEGSQRVWVEGAPFLAFAKRLNPGSLFPAAYEVCIFPLVGLEEQQRRLRWQVLGAGGLLLLGAFGASHFISGRLSGPVEKLAVDSEENRTQRQRAEAALESASQELQRSVRFSADASHQLKTPVTVLRAGLEELLTRENLTPAECTEIAALIHQSYRLSSLIEDLLLLSRMDAGRLKIEFTAVNLTELIEGSLDDLGALPDELGLKVETDFPPVLHVAGEKRYTAIILQNLLENARKYNRPGGRIQIMAREGGDEVFLVVGNTGRPITPAAQDHIFERFHRAAIGENVPGYGLGLNLARELARLHGGDLRLARSDDAWTEFEVRLRPSRRAGVATADAP